MRSLTVLPLALASLLALPAVTAAQHGHQQRAGDQQMGMDHGQMMGTVQGHGMMGQGVMGQGMMGMMTMMSGPDAAMILAQKETLKLEPSQVERLEKLRAEMGTLHQSHMQEVTPLLMQAREAFQDERTDLSAYKAALEKLAEHRVDMMMETAQISQNALEVLNVQQRSEVRSAMRMLGGMMQGAAGMSSGNCPMLQEMGGQRDDGN